MSREIKLWKKLRASQKMNKQFFVGLFIGLLISLACVKTVFLSPEGEVSYKTRYEELNTLYTACESDLSTALDLLDKLEQCP